MTPEKIAALKKEFPKGWHFKSEYIDQYGNVWHNGKLFKENVQDTDVISNIEKTLEAAQSQKTDFDKVETAPNNPNETNQLLLAIKQLQNELNEVKRNQATQVTQPHFEKAEFIQQKKPFGQYEIINKPVGDFMIKPKTYVMVGKGYSLPAYIKDGQEVVAPFNQPIYFRKEFDEITYADGNERLIPFCMYKTHSKAEARFIEESPYYGITIHPTAEQAKSVDLTTVDKIETVILRINSLDNNAILARAASMGMDLSQPADKLKSAIIKFDVQTEMSRTEGLVSSRIQQRELDNENFRNSSTE